MHRQDDSNYLLFIEPKLEDKLIEPIEDELTSLMEMALSRSKEGVSNYSSLSDKSTFRTGPGYKGRHITDCGVKSSNNDYLLENGMITNSLATFYLRWYRYSIPISEMLKIQKLKQYYDERY